jgi:hypothetical protein
VDFVSLDWTDYSAHFEDQGTLRNVVVLGTTVGDWQKMFDWIRRSDFPREYLIDGEPADFPGTIAEAFATVGEDTYSYSFDAEGLPVHGMVYSDRFADEIEMDIEPVNVTNQDEFDHLIAFMQNLSNELDKPVMLTQEMDRDEVILEIEPEADD